jgi:hypothetical protein
MKILAIALALMLFASAAFAGMNANVKVAVHVDVHKSRTCSKNFATITGCADIVFTWTVTCPTDIDVFPVFFDLVGVTGVQHNMTWPEATWYSCAYTKCAGDFQIGDIVNTGDGVAYTWSTCQYVPVVVCGFGWLWASTPGLICLGPNPTTGLLSATDCNFAEDEPICVFCAGACGLVGDDPCDPTATEPSTWGSIKSMFR